MPSEASLYFHVDLAAAGDREAFARAFVPLDLTEEELMGYVTDLRTDEAQWAHVRPFSHTQRHNSHHMPLTERSRIDCSRSSLQILKPS